MPSLNRPTQKSLNQLSVFLNLYQQAKKQYARDSQILVSHDQTGHVHFWLWLPKKFWSVFNFCESVSKCKKLVYSICPFFRYSQFKVPLHDWPHPFLTMPTSKTLKLIFKKLYQHAKNKLIPLVNSILESSDLIGHMNMLKMRLFHQFA